MNAHEQIQDHVTDPNLDHLSAGSLRRAAIHEAGRAVAAVLLDIATTVSVSLVPDGDMLAITDIEPRQQCITRVLMEQQITVALAGRAAEEVIFGSATIEAGGDDVALVAATALATKTVSVFGFSESVPLFWMSQQAAEQMLADKTMLGREIEKILARNDAQAHALARKLAPQIVALADKLLARHGLADDEIRAAVGRAGSATGTAMRPGMTMATPNSASSAS
jgi:cell division protease FtsH